MTGWLQHDDHSDHQGRKRKRRRPSSPDPRSHGEDPSSASLVPLYADSSWVAANIPHIQRQIVGWLRRRGIATEPAVEAFHEAIAQLYKRPRPLYSRRAVSRWLSRASWHAAENAKRRTRRWVAHHRLIPDPDPDASTVESGPEARWEDVAQLRAALRELPDMRRSHRDALLRVVQAELAAMGAEAEAEALGAALGVPTSDAGADRDQARKVLERAQAGLRARLRGWLAGVPVTRWVLRRHDVPLETRALALAASVVVGVASVSVLPGAEPSSASSAAETQVAARGRDTAPGQLAPSTEHDPQTADPLLVASGSGPRPTSTSTTTVTPTTIEVEPPPPLLARNRTTVSGEEREPGNTPLLCVRHLPVVGEQCVPHPRRTDPNSVLLPTPEK
jgi:DNA-directed RNA polymerase specialized sigma24 family protein